MTGAAAIDRLRGIAARLRDREDEAAEWFLTCLQEYEAGAPHGLTLDAAFGFRLNPGESAWYELEARTKRDTLLRVMRQRYFGGLSDRAAAAALAKKISRYEASDWRRDHKFKIRPTLTGLQACLFALLKIAQPLGASTIRRALAHELPLLVSHEAEEHSAATHEERHGIYGDETETETDLGSDGDAVDAA